MNSFRELTKLLPDDLTHIRNALQMLLAETYTLLLEARNDKVKISGLSEEMKQEIDQVVLLYDPLGLSMSYVKTSVSDRFLTGHNRNKVRQTKKKRIIILDGLYEKENGWFKIKLDR